MELLWFIMSIRVRISGKKRWCWVVQMGYCVILSITSEVPSYWWDCRRLQSRYLPNWATQTKSTWRMNVKTIRGNIFPFSVRFLGWSLSQRWWKLWFTHNFKMWSNVFASAVSPPTGPKATEQHLNKNTVTLFWLVSSFSCSKWSFLLFEWAELLTTKAQKSQMT